METRIATLLGGPSGDRSTHDTLASTLPSSGSQRPRPVEPTTIGDDGLMLAGSFASDFKTKSYYGVQSQDQTILGRSKSGAPIAQVLNNEASTPYKPHPAIAAITSPTTPFSGRLVDLLLDPSTQATSRSKWDERTIQPVLGESSVIKLPKLPQPQKSTTRRPRIPPLLQGLHQPPPLPPEQRLFPPITSENNAFPRKSGERASFEAFTEESRSKPEDENLGTGPGNSKSVKIVQHDDITVKPPTTLSTPPSQSTPEHAAPQENSSKEALPRKTTFGKRGKRRNMWSDEETKDLLVGVSKYGIGSWKKILHDPDFDFKGRSAVDCKFFLLKDRFRVCCPGEGLKLRKPKRKESTPEKTTDPSTTSPHTPRTTIVSSSQTPSDGMPIEQPTSEPQRGTVPLKTITELAEMGIHGPFQQRSRRPRRTFSAQDDKNLLKGYEKYGFVWHAMRDDPDLGFGKRHPTDLRDRFRIKYPVKYAKAGYKLKEKEERAIKDQGFQIQDQESSMRVESPRTALPILDSRGIDVRPKSRDTTSRVQPPFIANPSTTYPVPTNLPFKSFPLLSETLPLLSDEEFTEDASADESPITLNRNILQWADANPSSLSAFPAAANVNAYGTSSYMQTDSSLNLFLGHDGLHINPLATLKLPVAHPYTTSTSSSTPMSMSYTQLSHASPSGHKTSTSTSLIANTPHTHTLTPMQADTRLSISSNTNYNSNVSTNTSILNDGMGMGMGMAVPFQFQPQVHPAGAMPRTPNLPTIVFPHVPVASARGAVHNLPAPADLLMGVD